MTRIIAFLSFVCVRGDTNWNENIAKTVNKKSHDVWLCQPLVSASHPADSSDDNTSNVANHEDDSNNVDDVAST
jgi:hypothetical protein